MKKLLALVCMLLSLCVTALAADADTDVAAADYQRLQGGEYATVEFNERNVVAAIANLKVYNTLDSVVLPKGIKHYRIIRAGNEQAFLIVPHFAKTRMMVKAAATGKPMGALKGVFEGRSLVLFCNKGAVIVDLLVRSGHGTRLVNYQPEAEPNLADGQPGGVYIPDNQQRLLKDITREIRHDGDIIKVK